MVPHNRDSRRTRTDRRTFLHLLLAATAMPRHAAAGQAGTPPAREAGPDAPGHHVRPGGSIQQALEKAARDPVNKTVFVHAGTYRPQAKGQALIWFNARHDGITLQAVGDVVLTAANPEIADSGAPSYPAVVNHVVYFGDGISPKTVLRGFKITGANNFTTGSGEKSPIESDDIRKTLFFYSDGGGIKIYARSYPTIEQVEVFGNYTSPCGGGVSVEHLDQVQEAAMFRNCIFRDNRTQTTGSAVDLLHGSRADARELPVRRQRRQHGRRLRRPAHRRRIPPGARLRRAHGLRAIACDGQPVHVHRQLERRRRRRHRQQLRRLDFLEEHPPGGISPGKRYELDIVDGGGVKGYVHPRRRQRSARDDRPRCEHVRPAGPALRRAVRAARTRLRAKPAIAAGRRERSNRLRVRRSSNSPSTGSGTACFLPDGHVTSMLSTLSAAPRPKYSG